MKAKVGRVVIAVILIGVIVGGYYGFTVYRNNISSEDAMVLTEVQNVITKNLDTAYPATPREVVKFYNRIISCFYNEDITEEEMYALGDQARTLFDEELLGNNPRDEYFQRLEAEIDEYHDESRIIVNTSVCDSNDVVRLTIDGDECAYVTSSYFVQENTGSNRTRQMYVLRLDEEGRWKILVFYQIEEDSSDD